MMGLRICCFVNLLHLYTLPQIRTCGPLLHLQPVFLRGLRFVNRFWALTRVIRGFFDASKDDVRTSSRIGARSSVSTESAFGDFHVDSDGCRL